MRETFGSLVLTTQNYVVDPTTTSKTGLSDPKTFMKKELNLAARTVFNQLQMYKTIKNKTIDSEDGTQFYDLPVDFGVFSAATMEVGGVAYPLIPIDSQRGWDVLNQVDFSGSVIPRHIFIRRDDFGIWPIPSEDDLDIVINYKMVFKDLTADDYTTGTITTVDEDETVTGDSTVFVAGMAKRWLRADDDGNWYRINTFTDTTHLELVRKFDGTAVSGSDYTIGESYEIPSETHELLPHKAAAAYLAGPRRNPRLAQPFLNFFWTGDFENTSRRMKDAAGGLLAIKRMYMATGRSGSHLVRKTRPSQYRFDDRWTATLSA